MYLASIDSRHDNANNIPLRDMLEADVLFCCRSYRKKRSIGSPMLFLNNLAG